jgi:putative transposase
MSNYRRAFIPGGSFFFTLVTHGRRRLFDDQRAVDRLREGFRRTMAKQPFRIDAIVILPDHLHTVWQLPEGDSDFSLRWRLIKHYLASGIVAPVNHRGEKRVWQRRFWEHAIRDEDDWRNHLDYVHYNPVKHGYVKRPGDWRWSSFQRSVRRGWYSPGWGESEPGSLDGMEFE